MFWKYNIWGILCILFIFIVSATPGDQLPPSPFFDFDKGIHVIIYGALQICLLRGFLLQNNFMLLRKHSIFIAIIFSTSYGFLIELMQGHFFRNRSFDLYDLVANVVGVIAATIVWGLFFWKKIKRKVSCV